MLRLSLIVPKAFRKQKSIWSQVMLSIFSALDMLKECRNSSLPTSRDAKHSSNISLSILTFGFSFTVKAIMYRPASVDGSTQTRPKMRLSSKDRVSLELEGSVIYGLLRSGKLLNYHYD